jgi:hypothetical protein
MWHTFHILMIAPALVPGAWAAGESASDADVNAGDRLDDAPLMYTAVVGSPHRNAKNEFGSHALTCSATDAPPVSGMVL